MAILVIQAVVSQPCMGKINAGSGNLVVYKSEGCTRGKGPAPLFIYKSVLGSDVSYFHTSTSVCKKWRGGRGLASETKCDSALR